MIVTPMNGSYLGTVGTSSQDISDGTTRTLSIVTLNISFGVLVATCTSLRMYVRRYIAKAIGVDDYLMVAASIFSIGESICFLIGARAGLGKHIWVLQDGLDAESLLKITTHLTAALYASYITYATSCALVKLSIVASYLRIFPSGHVVQRIVRPTGGLVIAMWICSIFAIVFQCIPVSAAFDWQKSHRKCINIQTFFYISCAFNIASDFILWITPLPFFWKMKMNSRGRIGVILLFSWASFAIIASIYRVATLEGASGDDVTYTMVESANWSMIEVGTAIFCACIPSLKPLFLKLLPRRWVNTLTGRSAGSSNPYLMAPTLTPRSSNAAFTSHSISTEFTPRVDTYEFEDRGPVKPVYTPRSATYDFEDRRLGSGRTGMNAWDREWEELRSDSHLEVREPDSIHSRY